MYRRSVWSIAAAPLALALLAAGAARGDLVAYYRFDADFTDATGIHHGTMQAHIDSATAVLLIGAYVKARWIAAAILHHGAGTPAAGQSLAESTAQMACRI